MTQPTQVLPPWLSPALTTLVLPQTTEITTTLVFLPLTYYGPSIPLDGDFTYGGLTSPVSTSSALETTASSSATTPSSSATPTSISISATTPTASLTSASSSPPSSTSSAAASSTLLSRAQLIGIVIGSVLGALVPFLLLCIVIRAGRRRRNRHNDGEQLPTIYAPSLTSASASIPIPASASTTSSAPWRLLAPGLPTPTSPTSPMAFTLPSPVPGSLAPGPPPVPVPVPMSLAPVWVARVPQRGSV
ncbi:hypothetical protein DFH07DRAFT_987223 [Mycena maculata]|uniref:Mid2 domain-containing protein n=1 Tax=Mycena maculata TaxID=230809 RepID=A0AAD7I6Q5_9AGAR|nr:hypothetical protein DFH07DRAFT_987223 [Mycena maculata]